MKKRTLPKHLFAVLTSIIIVLPLLLLVFHTPAYATSITINPTSGTTGTSVSITGKGFVGRLATIHWDGQVMIQDIPISKNGELAHTFTIPSSCKGDHKVKVTDDSNWSGSSASFTFTVLPQIKAFPHIGKVGTEVTIVGNGFVANEGDIKLTWDGNVIASPLITANIFGKWSTTFIVPEATKGDHFIGALGNATSAAEVTEIMFIVALVAKVKPLSGPVGTEITIDGYGFRTGEDGVTITYDGEIIKCNIVAEADGNWSTTVTIPPSTKGHHTIGVYGSSFTPKGIVPDVVFSVLPQMKLNPASGKKGTKVTVTGTGFASNETLTISFDTVTLDIAPVADSTGSFNATFEIPEYKGEEHTVIVKDSDGNSIQASLITEKAPPIAPQLVSPKQGTTMEIFSSVGDVLLETTKYLTRVLSPWRSPEKQTSRGTMVTFDWTDVAGDGDINYVLHVIKVNDSPSPVLVEEDLVNSEYTTSEEDTLTPGRYMWKTKAVDDVGNESPWTDVQEFEVIPTSSRVFILSLAIPVISILVVVALAIVIWRLKRSKR